MNRYSQRMKEQSFVRVSKAVVSSIHSVVVERKIRLKRLYSNGEEEERDPSFLFRLQVPTLFYLIFCDFQQALR